MEALNTFYKKYEGLIKMILLVAPLLFAGWKYIGTYIDMPERMDNFEKRASQDSALIMPKIKKIDSISANENQDYKLILELQEENRKIKQYLQIQ